MNEAHLAKVNSNSKSMENIRLSKWREKACFWRQNSNYTLYHRKWREQECFRSWRQISNSNRMRNICRNGARSEADLAQLRRGACSPPPPPFLFLWLLVQVFKRPLPKLNTRSPTTMLGSRRKTRKYTAQTGKHEFVLSSQRKTRICTGKNGLRFLWFATNRKTRILTGKHE